MQNQTGTNMLGKSEVQNYPEYKSGNSLWTLIESFKKYLSLIST